jgi:hypothetical protein
LWINKFFESTEEIRLDLCPLVLSDHKNGQTIAKLIAEISF